MKTGLRALLWSIVLVLLLAGGAWGFWRLSRDIEGFGRGAIAVVMGVVIFWFAAGFFRQMRPSMAKDAEPIDVDAGYGLAYQCEMCGMELAVLKVAEDKAPKHCGEPMTLIQKGA